MLYRHTKGDPKAEATPDLKTPTANGSIRPNLAGCAHMMARVIQDLDQLNIVEGEAWRAATAVEDAVRRLHSIQVRLLEIANTQAVMRG